MYAKRSARSSQRSIQNLSGYISTRRTPRGAVSLRGLGRATPERSFDANGSYIGPYPSTLDQDLIKPLIARNAAASANQASTPNIYIATPSSPIAPAADSNSASANASSTGFSLTDVPWWGWAIAAYVGYSWLGGSR